MLSLLIIALVVLAIQILMFFSIRSRKAGNTYSSELHKKYHIKTRADAWKLLNNPKLPEAEKVLIEDLYKQMK